MPRAGEHVASGPAARPRFADLYRFEGEVSTVAADLSFGLLLWACRLRRIGHVDALFVGCPWDCWAAVPGAFVFVLATLRLRYRWYSPSRSTRLACLATST
jgi:hypothetical protein